MSRAGFLIIEQEQDTIDTLKETLSRESYDLVFVSDFEQALNALEQHRFDLVIIGLIKTNLCVRNFYKQIRHHNSTNQIPVIILTPKDKEDEIALNLALGADDCITKPFSPKILFTRIKAVLRRSEQLRKQSKCIRIDDLVVDPARRKVSVDNKEIDLTFMEFNILKLLAQKPGVVFNRREILETTRGDDYLIGERVVDVQIVSLRKKLGKRKNYIETVHRVGYRIKDPNVSVGS